MLSFLCSRACGSQRTRGNQAASEEFPEELTQVYNECGEEVVGDQRYRQAGEVLQHLLALPVSQLGLVIVCALRARFPLWEAMFVAVPQGASALEALNRCGKVAADNYRNPAPLVDAVDAPLAIEADEAGTGFGLPDAPDSAGSFRGCATSEDTAATISCFTWTGEAGSEVQPEEISHLFTSGEEILRDDRYRQTNEALRRLLTLPVSQLGLVVVCAFRARFFLWEAMYSVVSKGETALEALDRFGKVAVLYYRTPSQISECTTLEPPQLDFTFEDSSPGPVQPGQSASRWV